jgi:hypothetical protein
MAFPGTSLLHKSLPGLQAHPPIAGLCLLWYCYIYCYCKKLSPPLLQSQDHPESDQCTSTFVAWNSSKVCWS